jgi:hypothetical protein
MQDITVNYMANKVISLINLHDVKNLISIVYRTLNLSS